MKKGKLLISAISACLCAAMLTACSSSSSISFSANWYKYANPTIVANIHEQLEYSVTAEKSSGTSTVSYSLTYSNGTYVTELTTEMLEGESELVYVYTTTLTIYPYYTLNGETTDFADPDTVTTTTMFRNTKLQPIYSEKTVKSHSPSNATSPTSLEDCYTYYDYTVRIDYKDGCSKGTAALTYAEGSKYSGYSNDFEIGDNYTYIDNEELIFALRGMTLTSTQRVSTFNASTKQVETLVITPSSEATESFTFEIDGTKKDRTIAYYPTTIAKSGSNPGSTQTAWYAQNTRADTEEENRYRNVMLKLEAPISYNLGTLVYTLEKATFISA